MQKHQVSTIADPCLILIGRIYLAVSGYPLALSQQAVEYDYQIQFEFLNLNYYIVCLKRLFIKEKEAGNGPFKRFFERSSRIH